MSQPSFLQTPLDQAVTFQQALKTDTEESWIHRGEAMALNLFHEMSNRVPAYKDFLSKNNCDPATIKTIEDFARVPITDKDNYLRKYSRSELCWDGKFAAGQWIISTTSGSTGEPFYFPRTAAQDEYYALTAELYLRENFKIQDKKTLYINAFALGAWIGGLFTYEAVKRVAEKGYSLSIINPGINKPEVINSVRKLGRDFDQVIIGCYPPILKDIINLGEEEGLNWADYNLGVVFSAEGFSEEFRDYIVDHGKLSNAYTSTLNHYGTVDLGTMSHETPLSILIRREALKERSLFEDIFGQTRKQPTLTQFVPEMFYFETVGENVVCSSQSGLPLVRYDLKDHGGVVTLGNIERSFTEHAKNLRDLATQEKIDTTVWNLPFVYLYERSDFSVTFSGAQIYPEEIRRALMRPDLVDLISGKFTMFSGYDESAQNYLDINVELRKEVKKSDELVATILHAVVEKLLEENSEYRVLYAEGKEKLHPRVILWPNGHPEYFSDRGKQKWVKKAS